MATVAVASRSLLSATYQPFGQAIYATHFRVATLAVADKQRGPLLGIGAEQALTGRFVRATGAAGTKLEGSSWWTFVATDGSTFDVGTLPDEKIEDGAAVQVKARLVEPDMSYAARRGEPSLWIVDIDRTNGLGERAEDHPRTAGVDAAEDASLGTRCQVSDPPCRGGTRGSHPCRAL